MKPWKDFSKTNLVFEHFAKKNTLKKVPFLLVHSLWASKENEQGFNKSIFLTNQHQHIQNQLDHLFRTESGKMVAVLVKIFGIENIHMAEDVVQDALVSALETWKFRGMPDNSRAWLYRTAKNKAIDILRRNRHNQSIDFSDPERQLLASEYTLTSTMDTYWQDKYMQDDFLGMMYACCHPDISHENQITFILKSLCGFSTKEVARSFLTSEDTVSKRLYRTKEYFRKHKIRPEIPTKELLGSRTDTVLSAIYLIFNEGYNSTHSDQLIRQDLIAQAILLCRSLLQNKITQLPEVYALMGLMHFHAARVESRISAEGGLILLPDQDRNIWDQELIELGNHYLNKAAFGDRLSTYHIEAAIAYQHCIAKTFDNTNWSAILKYYDLFVQRTQDPVVHLNRSLAILELQGATKALEAINKIKDEKVLANYYLLYAIQGEIYYRMKQTQKAVVFYKKALNLTQSPSEKQFLHRKMEKILI